MENGTNQSCIKTFEKYSPSDTALYVTVGCLESFLIIISNVLTIAIIIKFPTLRNTSNILIANLAISDLLAGVLLIPRNVISVAYPEVDNTKYGCISKYFNWIFIICSGILNLAIISIDRFFAIMAPMKYATTDTLPVAAWTCAVTWMALLLPCLTSFWIFDTWRCWKRCTLRDVVPQGAFRFFSLVGSLALTVGFVFFAGIVIKLKTYKSHGHVSRTVKDVRQKTGMMVMVFGLFVVFLMPITGASVYASSVAVIENRLMLEWAILVAGANSFANSLIYGWKRPEFRKAYWWILTCGKESRQVGPAPVNIESQQANTLPVTVASSSKVKA